MFIVSEMTENPTAKYEKFLFHASLLINFGCTSVVVSIAPINLAVLQIMQVFFGFSVISVKKDVSTEI